MNRSDAKVTPEPSDGSRPTASLQHLEFAGTRPLTSEESLLKAAPGGAGSSTTQKGLVLDYLSPGLAAWAYPYLTHPSSDVIGLVLTAAGAIPGVFPIAFEVGPLWLLYLSALAIPVFFQRVALMDVRLLGLLCQRFECWWLMGNTVVAMATTFAIFNNPQPRFYSNVLLTTGSTLIVSDAMRMPRPLIHGMMASYAIVVMLTAAALFMKRALYVDYDVRLLGFFNGVDFFLSRLVTLGQCVAPRTNGCAPN
jgi:hypothetical protein